MVFIIITIINIITWCYASDTRTDKALEYVRDTILAEARAKVPKIVLLITDGGSDKTEITKSQAQLLRDQRNATIFVVAISNKVSTIYIYMHAFIHLFIYI